MKNKIYLIFVLLCVSTSVFAGGPGGDGVLRAKFLSSVDQGIEAITTQEGDYASLQDLREGFAKFKGLNFEGDTIELLDNHEIESFVLENGEIISIKN